MCPHSMLTSFPRMIRFWQDLTLTNRSWSEICKNVNWIILQNWAMVRLWTYEGYNINQIKCKSDVKSQVSHDIWWNCIWFKRSLLLIQLISALFRGPLCYKSSKRELEMVTVVDRWSLFVSSGLTAYYILFQFSLLLVQPYAQINTYLYNKNTA